MLIPVRCFTCGKITGSSWEPYLKLLSEGLTKKEALDRLGFKRYCCTRMLLCHVDITEKLIHYV